MSYDEEQQKRSRVVIETPTSRREVVHQQTVRYPEERRGFSTGVVVAVALTAIAATAIIFLFLMNRGGDEASTNINVRATLPTQPTPLAALPPPVIVQTPMTMPTPPPIIIQQAPPVTTAPPVVIQQPPATTTAPPPASAAPPPNPNDDATIQQKIDRAFAADSEITAAVINATVIDGKVLLTGSVDSAALKQKAESIAYKVKGVRSVENKIAVTSGTP